jgi:hypothetical protein
MRRPDRAAAAAEFDDTLNRASARFAIVEKRADFAAFEQIISEVLATFWLTRGVQLLPSLGLAETRRRLTKTGAHVPTSLPASRAILTPLVKRRSVLRHRDDHAFELTFRIRFDRYRQRRHDQRRHRHVADNRFDQWVSVEDDCQFHGVVIDDGSDLNVMSSGGPEGTTGDSFFFRRHPGTEGNEGNKEKL